MEIVSTSNVINRQLTDAYWTKCAKDAGIPEHMIHGVVDYVLRGHIGGSFLTTIFEGNFIYAWSLADMKNQDALSKYAKFLCVYAPSVCYGSKQHVQDWVRDGGYLGIVGKE